MIIDSCESRVPPAGAWANNSCLQSPQTQIESLLQKRVHFMEIPLLFCLKRRNCKQRWTVQTVPSSKENTFFSEGFDIHPKEAFALLKISFIFAKIKKYIFVFSLLKKHFPLSKNCVLIIFAWEKNLFVFSIFLLKKHFPKILYYIFFKIKQNNL